MPVMSDHYKGVAFLALMHPSFPVDAVTVFDEVESPAVVYLHQTFGSSQHAIGEFLMRNGHKNHLLQAVLLNQVCVRNENCKEGELRRGWTIKDWNHALENEQQDLRSEIHDRTLDVLNTLEGLKLERTRLLLQIALEDDFTDAAAFILLQWVADVWPYELVRNPDGANPEKDAFGVFLELHGIDSVNDNRADLFNMDGETIAFPHRPTTYPRSASIEEVQTFLERGYRKGLATLLWVAEAQGLSGESGVALPPRDRKPRLSPADISTISSLLSDNLK